MPETVLPLSFVRFSIHPNEITVSILFAVAIISVVVSTIFEFDDYFSFYFPLSELASVLVSVLFSEHSITMHYIIFPFTIVCFTIFLSNFTLAIFHIIEPESFIL